MVTGSINLKIALNTTRKTSNIIDLWDISDKMNDNIHEIKRLCWQQLFRNKYFTA